LGSIVKRARLVVTVTYLGLGFNEYDQAVLAHLATAGQRLVDIGIIDVSPRQDSATRLWPSARITSFLPPPLGDTQLQAWLSAAA